MRANLAVVALVGWACIVTPEAVHAQPARRDNRPNIVVIVADDMGYSDLGCYGGEIQTPNLDGLAANGARFTQFYNCSRCCQTRASLLTGVYPQRIGMGEFGRTLDPGVPTLAETLREHGYATAMVGKWHLSELPPAPRGAKRIRWMNHELELDRPFAAIESYPTRRGFDKFYGIIWGVVNHFDPFSLVDGETRVKSVPKDYYATSAFTDRSVETIRELADSPNPFFLYVAYTAPHWPIQAPPAEIAKYRGRYAAGWDALRRDRFARQQQLGLFDANVKLGENSAPQMKWNSLSDDDRAYQAAKMEVHAAMIDCVDQGVGRIVETLRDTGQLDNTVIWFFSDNGASPEIPGEPGYDRYGATRDGRPALRESNLRQADNQSKLGSDESYTGIGPAWASAVNTPLRFWKIESYEGGCRTPLIVHWPRGLKTPAGEFVRDYGHVIDITPTCLELARATQPSPIVVDGISLVPLLAGKSTSDGRPLYFSHMGGRGIRKGEWKAVRRPNSEWALFDIERDPGETNDLADVRPDLLASLIDEWTTWEIETAKPQAASAR